MKISILGGGFGIYGYLPAACSLGWEVSTLGKYDETILNRPELSIYYKSVEFVEYEPDLCSSETALVFARTPKMQFDFIVDNFDSNNNIFHYFFEKPIANSKANAQLIFDKLEHSGKSFSIGYLFQYTDWFMALEALCANQGNKIIINWRIPSTSSDWKNNQIAGGGICSFFLVHFVPLLTRLGFSISDLRISVKNGQYTLKSQGINCIEINAKIVTKDFYFEVLLNNRLQPLFHAQTPFGLKPIKGTPDPRVTPLKKYLVSALDGSISLDTSLKTERDVINFLNLCI